MARQLKVEIVGDSRDLERAFARSERAAKQFRRVVVGALGAAGAVGGVYTLTRALESTVAAAMEAQRVLGQTRNALERQGLTWSKYGKQIEAVADAQSQLSGFDDERLLGTFTNLLRSTHDVTYALRLNALAADVARGRNIELEAASQLVLKAQMGQIGALRRVGINLDKNATSVQALEALQRSYAGSAKAYGETAAGAQDRFRVAVENLQEQLGDVLLPSITNVANAATEWLNDADNQKQIINDFAAAVHALGVAAKFAADTIGVLADAWRSLPDFGKNKGALELVFGKDKGGGGNSWLPNLLTGTVGGGGNFDQQGRAIRKQTAAGTTGRGTAGLLVPADAMSAPLLAFFARVKAIDATQKAAEKLQAKMKTQQAKMKLQRERFQAGLENQWGWLQFGGEVAAASGKPARILANLRKQEAFLQKRIAAAGRTLDLTRKLWMVQEQIRDLNKNKAAAAGFHQVSAAKVAEMLGLGGDQRATMLLAALGKGGTLPTGGGAFGASRGGVVVNGNVHVHGVTDTRTLQDQIEKQNRGRPAVRRGAR